MFFLKMEHVLERTMTTWKNNNQNNGPNQDTKRLRDDGLRTRCNFCSNSVVNTIIVLCSPFVLFGFRIPNLIPWSSRISYVDMTINLLYVLYPLVDHLPQTIFCFEWDLRRHNIRYTCEIPSTALLHRMGQFHHPQKTQEEKKWTKRDRELRKKPK